MSGPFSTNELFLRSDRIAFGKIPPEVAVREERTIILPDTTGGKLLFGLSSMISTNLFTGTLETVYPQNAGFTFDILQNRLGISNSSPQYAIDINTLSGVRISGGTLVANAQGLSNVPTAALISTLPTAVFAPGTIPTNVLIPSGQLTGISVPTTALFGVLATTLFNSTSIPVTSIQSNGNLIVSTFTGDGSGIYNVPLANVNPSNVGNFFLSNFIPLSALASTGQIWIRRWSIC